MSAVADATVSLVVAIVSGLIAIVSLAWQAIAEGKRQKREHDFTREQRDRDRREAAEDVHRRYRDPLVSAADQLLSRIENLWDRHCSKSTASRVATTS